MSRRIRAAVVTDLTRPMEVEELALRDPAAHEVVVRTEASALCVTDVRQARGALGATPPPMVLGHSAVGVVEEVGSGVTRMRVGDRVAVPATAECGVCYLCSRGRSDQCEQHVVPGRHVADRPDGTPVHAGAGTTATYATHMNLREISAFPIESDLPAEHLSMLGCGISSGLGAVFNVAKVTPGSSAAVVGAGQFGLWIAQGLRVAGAERIVVVEPRADRRALALTLGATDVVDPAEGDAVAQVRELTAGRGADYGFEAAGPPSAMVDAYLMTRNAGTVVVGGVIDKDDEVTFPALVFAVRGRSVHSVQNGNCRMTRDLAAFTRLMEAGLIDPAPLVTGRYALEDIDGAVTAADEGRDLTGVVVPAGD
jgi:S-(hydroxymethyl)glutathione dehydrogenase/alcohol dehydrogenase